MIIAKQEKIYGIDVYSFYNSKKIPYQLTFQESLSGNHVEVCLVNLLGQNKTPFCKHMRTAITSLCYEYMLEEKCSIYFDIALKDKRDLFLFSKFARWIKIEKGVKTVVEITPYEGYHFVEFIIELEPNYAESIEVV